MWPFTKRSGTSDKLPIDGPWSVSHGDYQEKPIITRVNAGYENGGALSGYEHQVGIAVPFNAPEFNGLPSVEEDTVLGAVEDSICEMLEEDAESLIVASITTGGMREFVFYTKAPEEVKKRFEQLQEIVCSHKIQLMIKEDKEWYLYSQLG